MTKKDELMREIITRLETMSVEKLRIVLAYIRSLEQSSEAENGGVQNG